MLTVKHITPSGEQFVYETPHVNYVPESAKQCAPSEDSLWRYGPDGTAHEITDGTCYVMNGEGQTVATYRLEHDGAKSSLPRKPQSGSIGQQATPNTQVWA